MRITGEFRFNRPKEVGEEFIVPIARGRQERWRVVRERTELQPFEGGQHIYECEEILPESFLREIEPATD